ncbi:unnamed protein product [Paramecium primaurelia]|uniref:Uncharacterized protein n=1 Tax=Paramecium primaurelia TaxID=5886 RepID=A0A8S1NWN5_PARPR|nr:unnamed protein product [Paramecium primaurelia]
MNFQTQNKQVCCESMRWTQCNKEHYVYCWDKIRKQLDKTQILITIAQDGQILYLQNGVKLRNEIIQDNFRSQEIYTNMEQIQYFHWQGEYEKNQRKIGQWTANWNGKVMNKVGGYFDNGLKQGLWVQPIKNYWSQAQVYEIGEYYNDQKRGKWIYIYNDCLIGGGLYNQQAQKKGKWVDLSEEFNDFSQVTYSGEYKKDQKVGRWDILYRNQTTQELKLIGGGLYYQGFMGIKQGRWIEQSEGFSEYSQVTYNGIYKNSKKFSKWDTYMNFFGNHIIGGGSYNKEGQKIRKWKDLNEKFHNYSQVINVGQYKNGNKAGRWDILYRKQKQKKFKQIGGGFYDEGGKETKQGRWIDLSVKFYYNSEITYDGQYQEGKKVGVWDILSLDHFSDQFKKIGGGSYDYLGDGIKIGKWIDLNQFSQQITYSGEYQKGKKVGRWDIFTQNFNGKEIKQIGGGLYDPEGDEIKIGKWFTLDEASNQIAYHGEYQKGQKVGRWDCLFSRQDEQEFKQIGGGSYDDEGYGIKIGKWIDLDVFSKYIIYSGEYQQGKKVGKWDILFRVYSSDPFEQIGGGLYDENGYEIKQGKWIELQEGQQYTSKATYNGEYKNGKKVGRWDIVLEGVKIGGGTYDQLGDGIKNGKWFDLDENSKYITYSGEYQKGKKVGRWDILFREHYSYPFLEIGGGLYDDGGSEIKLGKWIEQSKQFWINSQITFNGEYKNGYKVGIWVEMDIKIKKKRDEINYAN